MYVTSTVEDKLKYLRVKIRYFGVLSRVCTEIGQKLDRNWETNSDQHILEHSSVLLYLSSQYSMSFSGNMKDLPYVMISININQGNTMNSGHY